VNEDGTQFPVSKFFPEALGGEQLSKNDLIMSPTSYVLAHAQREPPEQEWTSPRVELLSSNDPPLFCSGRR
jgi:hypothetical protein